MYIIVLSIIFFLVAIFFAWRLLSNRHHLPCPSYLSKLVEMDNPFAKENRSASIISHLKLTSGMHVADVGCGPGRVSLPLAKALPEKAHLVAIDMQRDMLEKVKKKTEHMKNVQTRQAVLGQGILEKHMYDYVLLVNVLGEIPNRHAALQEVFYALKPGGVLSITETVFDPHYQRVKKIMEIATPLGFKKKAYFGAWYCYTLHLSRK